MTGGTTLGRWPGRRHRQPQAGVTTTRYLLNDHLGSIAAIVDGSGAPILTESFDAFGARRDGEDWDSDCNCSKLAQIASITRHGFTGHEMIGGHSMGLIHMNGRVMDSVTGRFLSPDPLCSSRSTASRSIATAMCGTIRSHQPIRRGSRNTTGRHRAAEWEPPICWTMGICGGGLNLFPRNYVIVRPPEPKIPPSRATPGPEAGRRLSLLILARWRLRNEKQRLPEPSIRTPLRGCCWKNLLIRRTRFRTSHFLQWRADNSPARKRQSCL